MSKRFIAASRGAWSLVLVATIGGCFVQPVPSPEPVYDVRAPELAIGLEVEGPPIQVVVHDTLGVLKGVRAANKADAASIVEWPGGVDIQTAELDGSSRTFLIEWIGLDCDTVDVTLEGDPLRVRVVRQSTGCDTIPSFRGIVVELAESASLPFTLEIRDAGLGES